MSLTTFKFSNQGPLNLITSCPILSHLITPCHTLSPMFDTKVISMRTLNLVHRLLKILSHLATYYHMLPHLITLYSPSLIEKQCEWHQMPSYLATSYSFIPNLITLYLPCLIENQCQ